MDKNMAERLMEIYEDALDELMGAKHYIDRSKEVTGADCVAKYKAMAADELGHAEKLIREGDAMLKDHDKTHPLVVVWPHLKELLLHEHTEIQTLLKA